MRVHSFTRDDTVYDTGLDSCTCKAAYYHPEKPCKHQITLLQELQRALTFLDLYRQYDVRAIRKDNNHMSTQVTRTAKVAQAMVEEQEQYFLLQVFPLRGLQIVKSQQNAAY